MARITGSVVKQAKFSRKRLWRHDRKWLFLDWSPNSPQRRIL